MNIKQFAQDELLLGLRETYRKADLQHHMGDAKKRKIRCEMRRLISKIEKMFTEDISTEGTTD